MRIIAFLVLIIATSLSIANEYQCEAPSNARVYKWTGPTSWELDSAHSHNFYGDLPAYLENRYPMSKTDPYGKNMHGQPAIAYSVSDPGFVGPNGEHFGIEIEFGDTNIPPRNNDSKNVRFYTDFGQTGIKEGGINRAEMHIRSFMNDLGAIEGETLWLGWSEYYTHLDKTHITTVLQLRNQPSPKYIRANWSNQADRDYIMRGYLPNLDMTNGGPAAGITIRRDPNRPDGNVYWRFTSRISKKGCAQCTMEWGIPRERSHYTSMPVETGIWYDFVVQIKYSQNSDGRYRVWLYKVNNPDVPTNYHVTDTPEWDHLGSTMYNYSAAPPSSNGVPVTQPQIRMGLYRHDARKALPNVSEKDRYMIRYLGPMRVWVGDSDDGFYYVKPN